jgi:tetratricopeptide (TPR) repeat protein
MEEEVRKPESSTDKAWPFVMSWTGRISALIGLFVTLTGGVTWLINHHRAETERQGKMALAAAQAQQGEYPASIQTYGEILKSDPLYQPALDQQLTTTMRWVENFSVLATGTAGPALDQIMSILDAGLTRSKGSQAADIQAHIGWAHFLNQRIAEREFGPATEQNLRAALAADPSNVYANAMLGNWLLQTGGNFNDAIQHLNTAAASGKERPLVRTMQLGGLADLDVPGSRAQQVRIANDMRKGGEDLDERNRSRIVSFCFNPSNSRSELNEALTAVPPDEAWQTYLWLDGDTNDDDRRTTHVFIQASLFEVAGKRSEALRTFRSLQEDLKNRPGSLKDAVDASVARLSKS